MVRNVSDKYALFRENAPEVNYIDITKNTYIDSRMVTRTMARLAWKNEIFHAFIDYETYINNKNNL
jgi:hypothetical protein